MTRVPTNQTMLTIGGKQSRFRPRNNWRLKLLNWIANPVATFDISQPTRREIAEHFAREAELYLRAKYPKDYARLVELNKAEKN